MKVVAHDRRNTVALRWSATGSVAPWQVIASTGKRSPPSRRSTGPNPAICHAIRRATTRDASPAPPNQVGTKTQSP